MNKVPGAVRPKLVSFVLNNFTHDNRVRKTAGTLTEMGFDVTVVALQRGQVPSYEEMDGFRVRRVKLTSDRLPLGGPQTALRLAEFVVRVERLGLSFDVCHCNDIEALLVATLLKRPYRKFSMVYDTHEYAREKNGLKGFMKKFVELTESRLIKHAESVITVSEGIADEYKRLYGLDDVQVVYNAPHRAEVKKTDLLRKDLGIGPEKKIFLSQGGIVGGRGVHILVKAFELLKDTDAVLVFLGDGDLLETVLDAGARTGNIFHHPAVPPEVLIEYTASADFGLVPGENVCLSYYYSMPNKLFEYIQAQIPIIVTNLHDMRKLVERHDLGLVIDEFTPEGTEQAIRLALETDTSVFKKGLKDAGSLYNWESEEKKLRNIYSSFL